MRNSAIIRVFLAAVASASPFAAHGVPANFQNEILITGITEPTGITFTPDQRMLIIERGGRIWVVAAGAAQINPTPFLQISNINTILGERGLLGIALDPSFSTNGFYYVFYTANSPMRDRVSRFTASGNSTVAGSELVIWEDNNSSPNYHHGGAVAFGPDGDLYISVGMGDSSSPAQSLSSYRGKILRIRSNGTIPTDNPFYDGAGSNLDEIWALGLRNPYRFSFDSATGRMYIGDVGDNDPATSIEEVNVGAAGANYGWPVCQGDCNTPGMTNPISSYPHSGRDACITGGFVYRGTVFPAQYQGSYFYGDYVQNWIRRLTLDANGNVTGVANFEPLDGSTDGPYGDIVDLEQGPDGALYYVDIGLSWEGVTRPAGIRRIRYTSTNQPPSAQAWADVSQGPPPLTVNFSSAGSVDPEGQPLTYSWVFGDGAVSNLANPSHTYLNKGLYTVRLSVSDGVNSTFANNLTIAVGTPPVATITSPLNNATFRAGDVITYAGSAKDSKNAAIPLSALSWNIQFLHDNHTHPFLGPLTNTAGGTFNIDPTGHDYRGVTRYLVTLTATDSDGLQNTASVTIYPQKVNLTFAAAPSGLALSVDGIPGVTPFLWDDLIGFQHAIAAPNQSQGGTLYNFVSWSDSGAQTHGIVVPAQNQTYTANFQAVPLPGGQMLAYGFSEGSGGTTADSSGNNRTGTVTNAAWTAAGQSGNALVFNGTTARVAGPSITLPNAFTIMAWINNPSNQAYETIVSVGQDRDFYLESGVLVFESPVPGTIRRFGTAISNTTWHHVAVTSDGTSTLAYLDGNPLGTPQAAVVGSFTGTIVVGAHPNASSVVDFFSGTIDEVRVYGAALSQVQIQTVMNSAVDPIPGVPAIANTAPASATAGGAGFTLTVNGAGFAPASVVRWNGTARATAFASANQLTATISAGDIVSPGNASVTVFTPAPGGGTSNAQSFPILAPNPLPSTLSISPDSALKGMAGLTLTVNGSNFVNGSTVRWNGTNRTTSFVSASQLTATITQADLAAAGPAPVTVFTAAPGGGTSNAQNFTVATDAWVDFAWGGLELGTMNNPFNTLLEAVNGVGSGATIRIKAGQRVEILRIIKPVRVEASGGAARVGG